MLFYSTILRVTSVASKRYRAKDGVGVEKNGDASEGTHIKEQIQDGSSVMTDEAAVYTLTNPPHSANFQKHEYVSYGIGRLERVAGAPRSTVAG